MNVRDAPVARVVRTAPPAMLAHLLAFACSAGCSPQTGDDPLVGPGVDAAVAHATLALRGSPSVERRLSFQMTHVASSSTCTAAARLQLGASSDGPTQPSSSLLLPYPLAVADKAVTPPGAKEVNAFQWSSADAYHRLEFDEVEILVHDEQHLVLQVSGARICSGESYLAVVDVRLDGPCPPSEGGELQIDFPAEQPEMLCAVPDRPSERTTEEGVPLCFSWTSSSCSGGPAERPEEPSDSD